MFVRSLFVVALAFLSLNAHASFIFTFDMYQDVDLNINVDRDDTFSIVFDQDTDFANGVTWTDILSASYDSLSLGAFSMTNFTRTYSDDELAQFFYFDDLGNGLWGMDILVGEIGEDAQVRFQTDDGTIRFGQGDSSDRNGRPSSFVASRSGVGTSFLETFSQDTFTFSAVSNSASLPEPGTFGLLLLGFGLFRAKSRRNPF